MSDFGKIFGSDVADFWNEYKSAIGLGALGAITGGIGAGAAGGMSPLAGVLLGGAAGAGTGYFGGDAPRAEALALQAAQEEAARQRARGNKNLEDVITDITGPSTDPGNVGGTQPINPPPPPIQPPPIQPPPVQPPTQPPPEPITPSPDPGFVAPEPTLTDPFSGQPIGTAEKDRQQILEEAGYQQQIGLANLQERDAARQQYLNELSDLLTQRSERQFEEIRPEIYEDLNTRGLLRSSYLGEALGEEQASLESQVQEQLAMQALQDRGLSLNELAGVQQNYLGGRQSALSREFTLEDYARQLEASKAMGEVMTPVPQYSGGKNGAQGIQAGASALQAITPFIV